jgi:hypothetical protein
MITVTSLWLPILLSAVAVFVMSNILWMALPFWHRSDYKKLSKEQALLDSVSEATSGQYIAPYLNWGKLTPEERAAVERRPMAFVLVRNPAKFSFPAALATYFAYTLVISFLVGYVTGVALPPGGPFREVLRIAGTVGILAYSFGSVGDSIWYGKPWSVTAKVIIDGIIYGLLTGVIFAWLWPH